MFEQPWPWEKFTVVNVFRINPFTTSPQKVVVPDGPACGVSGINVTVVVTTAPVFSCTLLTKPFIDNVGFPGGDTTEDREPVVISPPLQPNRANSDSTQMVLIGSPFEWPLGDLEKPKHRVA
jgi:hypothetical protein